MAGRRPQAGSATGGKDVKDEVDPAITAARAGFPKRIKMSEIAAGSVLARPVVGTQGTPLFDEGTMLTQSTLERIKDVGVLMNFDSIWVYR